MNRGRGRNNKGRNINENNARGRGTQARSTRRRLSQDENQNQEIHEPAAAASNSSSSSSTSSDDCPHIEKTLTRTVLKEENVLITDQACKQCGKLLGTTTASLASGGNRSNEKKRERPPQEILDIDENERQTPKRQKTQQIPPPVPSQATPLVEPVILTREQKASQDWKSMTRTTFLTPEHHLPPPTNA